MNNIVIFGSGRSGTTALVRLLNQHSEILATNELGIFNSTASLAGARIRNPKDTTFQWIKMGSEIDEDAVRKEIVDLGRDPTAQEIINSFKKHSKKQFKYYCDKSPAYSHDMETVYEKAEHPKLILCMRDPRDVLCSQIKYDKQVKEGKRTSVPWMRPDAKSALESAYWINYMRGIDRFLTNNPDIEYFQVNYKNLINNSTEVALGISNFLNINYKELHGLFNGDTIHRIGVDQWKEMIPDVKLPDSWTEMYEKYK